MGFIWLKSAKKKAHETHGILIELSKYRVMINLLHLLVVFSTDQIVQSADSNALGEKLCIILVFQRYA